MLTDQAPRDLVDFDFGGGGRSLSPDPNHDAIMTQNPQGVVTTAKDSVYGR